MMKRIALALAVTVCIPIGTALAADYDPPIYVEEAAEEYVPVEVGSGWYLRGDASYSFQRDFNDVSARFDESLFTSDFIGVAPLDTIALLPNGFTAKERPYGGSIGFGYHFNDYLRADVNIGLLSDDKYTASGYLYADPAGDYGCLGTETVETTNFDEEGNEVTPHNIVVDPNARRGCGVNASMQNTSWNGTANAYIDLGTYAGFTPYVGAGVGLLYNRTKFNLTALCQAEETTRANIGNWTETNTFLCRGQDSSTDEPVEYNPINFRNAEYDFMYTLNAGFAYKVSKNTSIDVGYQYMSAPNLAYYTVSEDGIASHEGVDAHQVKVGLRYDLW